MVAYHPRHNAAQPRASPSPAAPVELEGVAIIAERPQAAAAPQLPGESLEPRAPVADRTLPPTPEPQATATQQGRLHGSDGHQSDKLKWPYSKPSLPFVRGTPVSWNELQSVFHLPRTQAANSFGIGLTYLKKICKGHRLRQWPSRKIQTINSTIDRIAVLRDAASPGRAHIGDNLIADVQAVRSEMYEHPDTPLGVDMNEFLQHAVISLIKEPEPATPVTGVGVPVL